MSQSNTFSPLTLLLVVFSAILLFAAQPAAAFGAGNIPSYSYLEDKAFRHGDIEDILAELPKVFSAGGAAAIGAVLGAVFGGGGGGSSSKPGRGNGKKFSPLDVKRVYFGNFLRDYSQAVDVGALKKMPLQTILNVVMVLGFMSFGYATGEFEITPERLGCYLPTEHIDNPKGYAEGEDARQYDPRLRGPIDPRELEVDPRTGMKNYIAAEEAPGGVTWDTSRALVRRVLESCIGYGRRARQTGAKEDLYEAYRLLGQALHTLEDFTAHSNWCELALWRMGHRQVFAHVGSQVRIKSPRGESVPPIVTGTFGGSDFIHSLLGEATDHLSEASVSDLTKSIEQAKRDPSAGSSRTLTSLLFDLPGASDDGQLSRSMGDVEQIRQRAGAGGIENMSPQELHATLWQILEFRDGVMKKIENTLDRIPGLGALVEKLTNSLNVFVLTTLEPYMKPLISAATGGLSQGSAEVVNNAEQYQVWDNPHASDPTHSFLSKDHFGLILNEPAGLVAREVVEHTVMLVVKAWDQPELNTREVTEPVLEALFHPFWHDGNSTVQRAMLERFEKWFRSESNQNEVLNRLSADAVRNHRNRRLGDTSGDQGHKHSAFGDHGLQGTLASHNVHVPGAQVLNAGQDLMAGKMPWQQGFGSGGPNAWREVDGSSGGGGVTSNAPHQGSQHFADVDNRHATASSGGGYDGGRQSSGEAAKYHQTFEETQNRPISYGEQQGWQQPAGYNGGYEQQQQQPMGWGQQQPPPLGQWGGPPPPGQYDQGQGQGWMGGPPPSQQGWGGPGYGGPGYGGQGYGGPPPSPPGGYGYDPNYQPPRQW